jgi:hypothetical protein
MAPGLVKFQHDRDATDRQLKSKYGIGIEEYEALYRFQAGKCAICKRRPDQKRRLAVDHDHDTGEVRGLLCSRCNLVLGQMDDKVEWFRLAAKYLKLTPWKGESQRRLSLEEHVRARQERRSRRDQSDASVA